MLSLIAVKLHLKKSNSHNSEVTMKDSQYVLSWEENCKFVQRLTNFEGNQKYRQRQK